MKKIIAFCISVVLGFALTTPAGAAEPGDTYSTTLEGPPVYITSGVAGDSMLAGTYEVPEAVGRTCETSFKGANGDSTHPDSKFVVTSANTITLNDVERSSGVITSASGLQVNGTITVTAVAGPEGLFSAGHSITLTCGPVPHQPAPIVSGYLVCEDETTWRVEELTIEGLYLESTFKVGDIVDTSQITVRVTYDNGAYGTAQVAEVLATDSPDCSSVVVTAPPTTAPPTTTTPTTTAPTTEAPPEETTTSTTEVTEIIISTTTPPSTAPPATTPPPTTPNGELPRTGGEMYFFIGGAFLAVLGAAILLGLHLATNKHSTPVRYRVVS